MLNKFSRVPIMNTHLLDHKQYKILEDLGKATSNAIPPLQKLEHSLHNLVIFLILPIFALANAGVTFSGGFMDSLASPVSLGVIWGLLAGKTFGIVGFVYISEKLKLIRLPDGLNYKSIFGVSCLAAIGFTMSLFITSLAFENPVFEYQAKVGILVGSLIAGITGYVILDRVLKKESA